jgi:formylglycine-generating enzyme required for sulfatase activity
VIVKNELLIYVLLLFLASCSPTTELTVRPITATPEPTRAQLHIETQTRSRDGMAMVYVPAGQFEMGLRYDQVDQVLRACNQSHDDCERGDFRAEQPAHTVVLDAFWIDQTEVTNGQFAAFLNEQGNQSEGVDTQFAEWLADHSHYSSIYDLVESQVYWLEPGQYGLIEQVNGIYQPESGYADYPVIEISWYGAAAYCDWIGGRLPTEAEWEYAARGPDSRLYTWGDTFEDSLANHCDASCTERWRNPTYDDGYDRWLPVGSYPGGASWCGALDMAGNVWEWVGDWYSEDYYTYSPLENPQGPAAAGPYYCRVRRGGSWYEESWQIRSTSRRGELPSSLRVHWVGFRCAVPAQL